MDSSLDVCPSEHGKCSMAIVRLLKGITKWWFET